MYVYTHTMIEAQCYHGVHMYVRMWMWLIQFLVLYYMRKWVKWLAYHFPIPFSVLVQSQGAA